MAQPFIGEIRLVGFNFAPVDWSFCDGSLIGIDQNAALFDLIGTTYGGNGTTNFQLPNLLGRVPIHMGTSPQGNGYVIGESGGSETVGLIPAQLPAHTHTVQAGSAVGSTATAAGNFVAIAPLALGNTYGNPAATTSSAATTANGGGQAHDNMQPFQVVNYIIALFGIFPSQG